MNIPARDVRLRKRSTRYDFAVTVTRGSEHRRLYEGSSRRYVQASYWQGVKVAAFLGMEGIVELDVLLFGDRYGRFATELAGGKVTSLHIPSGNCTAWTRGDWIGDHLAEQLLATIPGMPGPIPFPD
jgi:hypothetical protein